MRISFRHGIVKYQQPDFLNVTGSTVTLLATVTPFVATIAYGIKNFLVTEYNDIPNAWSGIVPGVDQWLYVDIDTRTGAKSFGITSLEPIISLVEPINPTYNQHWFDLNTSTMKVWDVDYWYTKIRLFVCLLEAGSIPQSLSDNLTRFSGTQINDYTDVNAGTIIFDSYTGFPIKDSNGMFITSEDNLLTSTSDLTSVKLESLILEGVAATNIPKYSIVKFVDYGIVRPATEYTSSSSDLFGIITEDAVQGYKTSIITSGLISNDEWDWSPHPVNTPVYCNTTGLLTVVPLYVNQIPVATIIDPNTIALGVPHTQLNIYENVAMTTTDAGIARLSVPSAVIGDPVVVGDNDPRMTNSRAPLAHTHIISDVTNLQTTLDAKLNLAGGTMTGPLSVINPSAVDHATTKMYVDSKRLDDLHNVSITNINTNDIIKFNGTTWINTQIPSSNVVLQGDVTGSGTTAAPISVSLSNVAIPGTFTKVTIDTKGRVTLGETLLSTDIPSLDWSKITSGKPTTLAGYGITDAYTKTETNALNWTWSHITSTPSTLSGYGITDAYTKTETNNLNWTWSHITSTPTTLAGYGIGNAVTNASGTPSIYQDAASNRPSGTLGQLFVDTTNNKIQRYNGTSWVDVSGNTITLTGDVSGSGTTSIAVTLGTVPIDKGGTGQTTASAAINALVPSQVGNSGKVLSTNGTSIDWINFPTQLVTSVNGQTGTVNITTISGNAASATILQTSRTISLTGDATGSANFNGAANASIVSTLATVNSNVGTFGSATAVPTITVNGKGLVTAVSTNNISFDWSIITNKPTTLLGYGIIDAAPLSHTTDQTIHLTSTQNTWLDSITASSTEVNRLVGVTSDIQTQLDSKVNKAGSTMSSGANITFTGNGEILGLPTIPSSTTAATSKAYVDALVVSGTTWRNPIADPNLIDVVSSIPGSPVTHGTYIKFGGTQSETWGTLTNVVDNDVVTFFNSDWIRIGILTTGMRLAIAAEDGTIGTTLSSIGFVNDDIIQYVSGQPNLFASWSTPDGRGAGGGTELIQGTTVLVNNSLSSHFGHIYLYNATTNNWVEISGPGAINSGVGLYYSGNTLNINLGAGITQLPTDEVGIDVYSAGGLMTTLDGTTSNTTTSAQLAIKLNGNTLSLSSNGLSLTSGIVTANTYKSVTVDTYGRVTAGSNPTTLSGYGITDAQPLDSDLTAIAALTGTSGFLKTNGSGTWSVDTSTYLTSNQNITLSGDVSGSGTTSIIVTLGTVPINKGGTGQTTANAAFNALVPSQTSNSGKYLTTDGTNTSWSTVSLGATNLDGLTDVIITSPSTNQILRYNGTDWVNSAESSSYTLPTASAAVLGGIKVGANLSIDGNGVLSSTAGGTGTVTSVAVTGSTGLTVGGSPITNSGTITLTLDSSLQNLVGLGSSGFITKTGSSTYGLDTSTYLTSNQNITLSGDVSGSGTTSIAVTLGTVPISKGGTGQTSANAAFNALVPSQTSNSGKYLTTDGTNTSWATVAGGSSDLDGLTDVVITTPITNQVLQYDGSNWINATNAPGPATNVSLGSVIVGQNLSVDGDGVLSISGGNGMPAGTASIVAPGDPYYGQVVLLLPMDGANASTIFNDRSSNTKTITAVGNARVSTALSKFGGASAKFDGTGDYLTIPDSEDFNLGTSDFTIECWYSPLALTGASTWKGLLSQRTTSSSNQSFCLYVNQNNTGFGFAMSVDGTTSIENLFGSPLTIGQWYHVAISRVGVNLYCAVNGVVVQKTGSASALFNSTALLSIGRLDGGGTDSINGYIDDVRITKGTARYIANFTPPTIAHYTHSLSEADPQFANVILLLSYNGTHGSSSITNTSNYPMAVTTVGTPTISRTYSKAGPSSLSLNGTTQYIKCNDVATMLIGLTQWTIEGWFYHTSFPTAQSVLYGFHNSTGSTNRFVVTHFQTFGSANAEVYPTANVANTWYHFASVRNGSTISTYRDGTLVSTRTVIAGDEFVAGDQFSIGQEYDTGNATSDFFAGYMGPIRITKNVARYTSDFVPVPMEYATVTTYPGTGSLQWNNGTVFGGSSNLVWDSTNNYMGVNKTTPVQALDVVGNIAATGTIIGSNISSIETITPPPTTGWSWVNQGSASVTTPSYGIILSAPGAGTGANLHCYVRSTALSTFTLIAKIHHNGFAKNYQSSGVVLRDSSTGKITVFDTLGLTNDTKTPMYNTRVSNFTNATTWSSDVIVNTSIVFPWFKIVKDASNLTFFVSTNGSSWLQYHQVTATSFLATIDQVGFAVADENSTTPNLGVIAILESWSIL